MSFPRYPNYKPSGVEWFGDVPEHWETKRIGYFFEERREKVSDKEYPPLSVTMRGIVPQIETAAKSDDGDNRRKVCPGDFVINSRSDRKGSSGVSTLEGSVSLICTVLRPHDTSGIHAPFIHHLLRSEPFQEEFYRNGKGIVADLWSTNYSAMRNILLAMPPPPEQSAIASFLDRETAMIDELIEEQKHLLELLKEKRRAVISQAVTKGLNPDVRMRSSGIDWLGNVPEHWETPPLFTRYQAVLGKMVDEKKRTGNHAVRYLRNADVNWDRINVSDLPTLDVTPLEEDRCLLRAGDVLICEGGAGIGQTAIWNGELERCAFQKALHRLRPWTNNEVPRFIYYCMRYVVESGVVMAGGTATIPHLTGEQLRRYRFPCPPVDEQQQVVAYLDVECAKIEKLTTVGQHSINLLQERRSALISAAVTGQIDVRNSGNKRIANKRIALHR